MVFLRCLTGVKQVLFRLPPLSSLVAGSRLLGVYPFCFELIGVSRVTSMGHRRQKKTQETHGCVVPGVLWSPASLSALYLLASVFLSSRKSPGSGCT